MLELAGPTFLFALLISLSGVQMALRWRAPSEKMARLVPAVGWRLGLFGGLMLAFKHLNQGVEFPPHSSNDWYFYFAAIVGFWSAADACLGKAKHPMRIFLGILLFSFFLKSRWGVEDPEWSIGFAFSIFAGLSLVVAGLILLVERGLERDRFFTVLAMGGSVGLLALILVLTGSVKLAMTAGAVSLAFFPLLLMARKFEMPGLVSAYGFIAFPLVLSGYFYSDMPWVCGLMLFIPVLFAFLARSRAIVVGTVLALALMGYAAYDSGKFSASKNPYSSY